MKKSLLIFVGCLLMSTYVMAQAPQLFNYQGIAHGNTGPISNQAIGIKISIIDLAANGNILYAERHVDTTNNFGLYAVTIGAGSVLNGNWGNVDWASGDKYINVAIDPSGGTTYANLGTTQLLSVPYAIYAGSAPLNDTALGMAGGDLTGTYPNPSIANNAVTSNKIANNTITAAKLSQMGADTGDVLMWNGSNWAVVSDSSGWSLSGNNVDSTAFIGTLNDQDIRFKRNGVDVGRIDTSNIAFGTNVLYSNTTGRYNKAFGTNALYNNTTGMANNALGYRVLESNTTGSNNNALGPLSLYSNTTGSYNNAIGHEALLYNTTGSNNNAVGNGALAFNTIGNYNNALGNNALSSNTTGSDNNAMGDRALYSNTTGFNNNAIGDSALYSNTTGEGNQAVGKQALYFNTTGYFNSALGDRSLYNNTTGNDNYALGWGAGYSNETGDYLTIIGSMTDVNSTSYSRSGAFGAYSVITASDQYRIGASFGTSSIGGRVAWSTVSDGRFKTNVKEDVAGLAFIQQLRPVTYKLDDKKIVDFIGIDRTVRGVEMPQENPSSPSTVFSGFIAQEVEAIAEKLGYDFHGVDKPKNEKDYYGLRYAEFVVPLVKAVQEQQDIIDTQNEKIANLENMVQQLLNKE